MNDLLNQLVDLYAGRELSEEGERQLEAEARQNPELGADMRTLRAAVDAMRNEAKPEFTEETYQRVLMKLYNKGAEPAQRGPDPAWFQYQLPIQS